MNVKNYISAFFILVFLGKMITMDAKIFSVLLDPSEVTVVNKLCPKKQFQAGASKEFAAANLASVFEYQHLCQTVFDIKISHTSEQPTENNFRRYNYKEPADLSTPGEKFYPPPRA